MKTLKPILIGGLIAGALDIVYAFAAYGYFNQAQPMRILQTIAGGVLGRDAAREGGWNTAALGLALHFLIALGMAAAYVLVSRFVPILRRMPLVWGPLYGLVLYFAMTHVIVPNSALQAPLPEYFNEGFWIAIVAHCVLVGPAITLTTARFAKD